MQFPLIFLYIYLLLTLEHLIILSLLFPPLHSHEEFSEYEILGGHYYVILYFSVLVYIIKLENASYFYLAAILTRSRKFIVSIFIHIFRQLKEFCSSRS